MRKYSLLLTARDKVRHVAVAVKSMFAQTGPPIELLLSDQGSVDGTREILDHLASTYDGPHKVRRINCPLTDVKGMPGLNAHVGWAMDQTDADVVMQLSADDYDLAQRSELTIAAFEEHNPSMVLGSLYYVDERMVYQGETIDYYPTDSWSTLEDQLKRHMGGSTCQAWTREFWNTVAPLEGVGSLDVSLPPLAVLLKGAYWLRPKMHAYRRVDSATNTGLEGVRNSYPEGSPQRDQAEELIHFQVTSGYYFVLARMTSLNLGDAAAHHSLAQAILDRNASWHHVRCKMSFDKTSPLPFKT
jgi:glycosyltransferase involved in cell wall biosynthesis